MPVCAYLARYSSAFPILSGFGFMNQFNKLSKIFLMSALISVTGVSSQACSSPAKDLLPDTNAIDESSVVALINKAFPGRNINQQASAPLVSLVGGKLAYGLYANRNQDTAVNIIPDFSHAGYMGGGVSLPAYKSIPVQASLSPSGGDDLAQLQAAVDNVSLLAPDARGIRGAILLSAGEFKISGALKIKSSGVVLRGSGQGKGGTTIRATTTTPKKGESVLLVGQQERSNSDREKGPALAASPAKTQITDDYVPVGATAVNVASVAGYSIGDEISVVKTPNSLWLGTKGIDTAQFGWTPSSYTMLYTRKVVAIKGNTIVFNIPLVDAIEARFGGGRLQRVDTSSRIQQVGIENLRLETLRRDNVSDKKRASYGITLGSVENSWVRDVTVSVVSHGYNFVYGARFNTAQDVAFVEPNFSVKGGNNYGFVINDGESNLFQRCYGRKARHTFITGSRVTGPNVYLDCLEEDTENDSGPHHRWATGTLYDNTKGDELFVQNRVDLGSGHGWSAAQNMLWNTEHSMNIVEAPPHAMNWAVGLKGDLMDGKWADEPEGIIERKGSDVVPRSLYLKQLEERLGVSAVQNITVPAQRQKQIWGLLKLWRGESRFMDTNLPR